MLALKDLLTTAMRRAHIGKQVSAARLVSVADDALFDLLGQRKPDARAVSYHAGILTIETRHASASQFLKQSESSWLSPLKQKFPGEPLKGVRYRIVGRFRGSEVE